MLFGKRETQSFMAVAMAMIVAGIIIFVFGALGWWINVSANQTLIAFPSMKVIGGLIVMSLGYIQLEIGLLRRK